MSAQQKLTRAAAERGSLCVGLDPDRARLPACVRGDVVAFLRQIIFATSDLAAAYKVNSAFFESMGAAGYAALSQVRAAMPTAALFIWDAKRGDIENTNQQYAQAAYDDLGADAVTVHPYLGLSTLEPFFRYEDRLTFVLCATSEGSELQDLCIQDAPALHPAWRTEALWQWVARAVAQRSSGQCGLVVGATKPDRLAWVQREVPNLPLLIPGVGAQGGSLPTAAQPTQPRLINVSRSILYADSGPDFASAAREAALRLAPRDRAAAPL